MILIIIILKVTKTPTTGTDIGFNSIQVDFFFIRLRMYVRNNPTSHRKSKIYECNPF